MALRYCAIVAYLLFVLLYGCAQVANNFTDGLAAIAGQGGTIARSDILEETKTLSAQLAAGRPGTAWETTFPDEAADLVQFIDSERVLVGTVESGAYLGVPDFKKLIMYNVRSGARIWEAERAKLSAGKYVVLAMEPHFILFGTSPAVLTLAALDPSSGRRIWEREFKFPIGHALSQSGNRLFVTTSQGAHGQLHTVDLRTGSIAWSQELPAEISVKNVRLIVQSDGDDIYVAGRMLARFTGDKGKLLWKAEHVELASPVVRIAPVADGLIAWSGKSISLIDKNNGHALWRNSVTQGVIKFMALYDERIIQVTAADPSDLGSLGSASDRMASLDLKSGKLQWSREIDGIMVSEMTMESGLLLFSLEEELVALQAASGEDHFRRLLPVAFRIASPTAYDPAGQPDLLRVREGKLHLARESAGIVTYSLQDGAELWHQGIYVTTVTAYPYATAYRVLRLKTAFTTYKVGVNPSKRIEGSVYSPQPSFEMQRLQTQERNLALERRNAEERHDHGRVAQIVAAEKLNAMMQINESRSQAGWALINALLGLQSSLAAALKQTAVEGLVSRISMEIDNTALLHHGAFQGHYYLRPFQDSSSDRMQGVTLVDLETGKRCDLVVSPYIRTIVMYGIEIPQLALDPAGERFITIGVGLRPERYEDYVAWKVRQARPSVLAYEVATLPFVDKNDALEKRLAAVAIPSRETQLLAASTTGSLYKLLKLLNSKININVRDTRGYTALMRASEANNETVTRLLLQKGVSVNLANKGQTALDLAKDANMQKILMEAGAKKGAELR